MAKSEFSNPFFKGRPWLTTIIKPGIISHKSFQLLSSLLYDWDPILWLLLWQLLSECYSHLSESNLSNGHFFARNWNKNLKPAKKISKLLVMWLWDIASGCKNDLVPNQASKMWSRDHAGVSVKIACLSKFWNWFINTFWGVRCNFECSLRKEHLYFWFHVVYHGSLNFCNNNLQVYDRSTKSTDHLP